jgi:hypothetical protein
MRRAATLGVIVAVFAGVLAARAARSADTAECHGFVLDENAVPVASAQLTLTRPNELPHRVETDGAGRFALRNLSPGEYQAEVRKEGFFVLSGTALSLQPGTNEITFTLNHAQELHERVDVVSLANQVDTQDTTERAALTAQEIRDIPVPNSHDLNQSLIATLRVRARRIRSTCWMVLRLAIQPAAF